MSRYFIVQFNDLQPERRQEIIDSVKEDLLIDYKNELEAETEADKICTATYVEWRVEL